MYFGRRRRLGLNFIMARFWKQEFRCTSMCNEITENICFGEGLHYYLGKRKPAEKEGSQTYTWQWVISSRGDDDFLLTEQTFAFSEHHCACMPKFHVHYQRFKTATDG